MLVGVEKDKKLRGKLQCCYVDGRTMVLHNEGWIIVDAIFRRHKCGVSSCVRSF